MSRADIKAELEAFIKSSKATTEVNSGNFVTTHIDPMKIAEHFYEQAEKDFIKNAEKWFIVRLPIILDEHNPISVKGIFEDFRKAMEMSDNIDKLIADEAKSQVVFDGNINESAFDKDGWADLGDGMKIDRQGHVIGGLKIDK